MSVPVLSVKIAVTAPKVSVAVNSRTIALRFAILLAPMAKTIEITAGNPSGTAATKAAIEIRSISFISKCR